AVRCRALYGERHRVHHGVAQVAPGHDRRMTSTARRLGVRNTMKDVLRRTGLLLVAFRMHERVRALAGSGHSITVDDGLPVPPAALRTRVAGTANVEWFLTSGRAHAVEITEIMADAGAPLESAERILDFGCGCGRVVRHWRDLGARVHGADHD